MVAQQAKKFFTSGHYLASPGTLFFILHRLRFCIVSMKRDGFRVARGLGELLKVSEKLPTETNQGVESNQRSKESTQRRTDSQLHTLVNTHRGVF